MPTEFTLCANARPKAVATRTVANRNRSKPTQIARPGKNARAATLHAIGIFAPISHARVQAHVMLYEHTNGNKINICTHTLLSTVKRTYLHSKCADKGANGNRTIHAQITSGFRKLYI